MTAREEWITDWQLSLKQTCRSYFTKCVMNICYVDPDPDLIQIPENNLIKLKFQSAHRTQCCPIGAQLHNYKVIIGESGGLVTCSLHPTPHARARLAGQGMSSRVEIRSHQRQSGECRTTWKLVVCSRWRRNDELPSDGLVLRYFDTQKKKWLMTCRAATGPTRTLVSMYVDTYSISIPACQCFSASSFVASCKLVTIVCHCCF